MMVVDALKQLPEYDLYISSARTVFVDAFLQTVTEKGMSKRVHHLGKLSDEQLRGWYQKADALVQPSLSEGFGLTGIEAMAAGVPVVASDIPIFQEIYQDAFLPFDPRNPDSFAATVHTLTAKARSVIIAKGKKVARTYSWKKMAAQTLDIYRQCLQ